MIFLTIRDGEEKNVQVENRTLLSHCQPLISAGADEFLTGVKNPTRMFAHILVQH
jgi:hypothetical protein